MRPGMGNAEYVCTVCNKEHEEKDMASGVPEERIGVCDDCSILADDSAPVEDLGLIVRTWSVLKRSGVNTVGELKQKSREDLMRMRNMGAKSIREIDLRLGRETTL